MVLIDKAKAIVGDVRAYWKVPASGDFVAYREYVMLSIGWLGMRFATSFGVAFAVNNPFTAMTLHMTHKDLLILGYICTAIGYVLAPLNAWIIDNLRSRDGKYRVYVKLAVPAGILSLFALFFPYEKMGYLPMVISLFLIGQIQGYVQNWYSVGVSNLVYVISPNSQERVKIMTVSSLVHNFAPSVTGLLIPILSDVFAGGDLYNIRTYRIVYPAFIVIGVAMSMTAYFGVKERIVTPRSRITGIGLIDAIRSVAKNKLYWIKSADNWNNFMEDSKNVLMQWLFYYGKVGSMTTYGIMDTLSYNSSMWAMLFAPWMINTFGKKGFKLVKNISQIFITLGLTLTYKRKHNLVFIFIFYFLNRFFETTEVVDRSIESDIRDYQQYISGERIDGTFGVVDTFVGGAVGAVTNLFVPWVYKRNGFDGTDYSVLNVYNDDGSYNEGNVLYSLLDKLMIISLVGAIIDVLPWFLYDLSDADQKAIIRVIRLRSSAEDINAGVRDDEVYCEACEGIFEMRKYLGKEKQIKIKTTDKQERKQNRLLNRDIKKVNEEIEIADFLDKEISKYNTAFGIEFRRLCHSITECGKSGFFSASVDFEAMALALPQGADKEEKTLRADAIRMMRSIKKSGRAVNKYYPAGLKEFSNAEYEALYELPEADKEQRRNKNSAIRAAEKERKRYARVMKPYLWAERNSVLADCYDDIDSFVADYQSVKASLEQKKADEKAAAEKAQADRKAEAARRLEEKNAKKKLNK